MVGHLGKRNNTPAQELYNKLGSPPLQLQLGSFHSPSCNSCACRSTHLLCQTGNQERDSNWLQETGRAPHLKVRQEGLWRKPSTCSRVSHLCILLYTYLHSNSKPFFWAPQQTSAGHRLLHREMSRQKPSSSEIQPQQLGHPSPAWVTLSLKPTSTSQRLGLKVCNVPRLQLLQFSKQDKLKKL